MDHLRTVRNFERFIIYKIGTLTQIDRILGHKIHFSILKIMQSMISDQNGINFVRTAITISKPFI